MCSLCCFALHGFLLQCCSIFRRYFISTFVIIIISAVKTAILIVISRYVSELTQLTVISPCNFLRFIICFNCNRTIHFRIRFDTFGPRSLPSHQRRFRHARTSSSIGMSNFRFPERTPRFLLNEKSKRELRNTVRETYR